MQNMCPLCTTVCNQEALLFFECYENSEDKTPTPELLYFPIAFVLCPVTPEVIIVSYMCHSLFAVSIHFDAINACQ